MFEELRGRCACLRELGRGGGLRPGKGTFESYSNGQAQEPARGPIMFP